MIQPANGPLYIRILGRLFKIVAIAESQHEANEAMFADHTLALIDTLGPLALLAKVDDKGIPCDKLEAS